MLSLRGRREDCPPMRPGFEVADRLMPAPTAETGPAGILVLAAVVRGATPEEIAGYLVVGFPPEIETLAADPLERDELISHLGLLERALIGELGAAV